MSDERTIQVRVPTDVRARLIELADAEGVPAAEWVREAIRQRLSTAPVFAFTVPDGYMLQHPWPFASIEERLATVLRFARYYDANPTWGVLHVAFDDDNFPVTAREVEWAMESRDDEGAELAAIAAAMTEPAQEWLRDAAEGACGVLHRREVDA